MAEDGALGNSRQEMVERFIRIPGLGRSRAEHIYDAGYTNIGLLRKASVEELTKIPGVGMSLARCVKDNLDRVQAEAPAAVPEAPGASSEPQRIVVGAGAAPDEKRPEAPAPAAPPAASAQSRGFLSSIFDKLLGKPTPAQAPAERKEGGAREPEKKGPESSEGVKVESAPAARKDAGAKPEENKETAKAEPAMVEPPKPEAPAETKKEEARTGAKPNEIKVDSKPDDR